MNSNDLERWLFYGVCLAGVIGATLVAIFGKQQ